MGIRLQSNSNSGEAEPFPKPYILAAYSDALSGKKNAVIPYWSYPKKVYQWYKSAEAHNKQSFKPPCWQLFPLISSYSDDRELLMDILKYSTEVEVNAPMALMGYVQKLFESTLAQI